MNIGRKEYSKSSDQYDDYLPSPNLERRKKPVTLSPFSPRLIYQIPEKEIRSDVELILAAVKKHKLAFAVSQLKSRKIK
ncbi:Breast cancer metastasis-suppressor [Schistosoma japonicum]|nr:Breast cancer metastasis-suppressor [Schistosoma japonicum]